MDDTELLDIERVAAHLQVDPQALERFEEVLRPRLIVYEDGRRIPLWRASDILDYRS